MGTQGPNPLGRPSLARPSGTKQTRGLLSSRTRPYSVNGPKGRTPNARINFAGCRQRTATG